MKSNNFLLTLLTIATFTQSSIQAGSTGKAWGIGLGAACGGMLVGNAIAKNNNRREVQYQDNARAAAEEEARYQARRAREEREERRQLERELRAAQSRQQAPTNIRELRHEDRLTFDEDLYF